MGTHVYFYMLVSDNVPPYDSHNFKIYYKRRGIRHRPVTELRPHGNAMAERMVKMIQTPILDDKDPRREYNNTPHSFTGKTPAEILMKLFQRTNLPSLPAKPYSEDKTARE